MFVEFISGNECDKKSKLRCMNCHNDSCDIWKITQILSKLNLL
mgnify:CR=1 FL=1